MKPTEFSSPLLSTGETSSGTRAAWAVPAPAQNASAPASTAIARRGVAPRGATPDREVITRVPPRPLLDLEVVGRVRRLDDRRVARDRVRTGHDEPGAVQR